MAIKNLDLIDSFLNGITPVQIIGTDRVLYANKVPSKTALAAIIVRLKTGSTWVRADLGAAVSPAFLTGNRAARRQRVVALSRQSTAQLIAAEAKRVALAASLQELQDKSAGVLTRI